MASSKILEVVKGKVRELRGTEDEKVEQNKEKVEELGSDKGEMKEEEERVLGAEKENDAADSN